MTLISSEIENVRALELPNGVWADGRSAAAPRMALVKWRACPDDKLYQIYVNGKYAGLTLDNQQRQILVQMPASPETPVRIEVFAVEARQADTDFSSQLDSANIGSGRVRICFLRSQNLPSDSVAQIYCDFGSGEIDYGNPLNSLPVKIWPVWQDKAGFAMSRFGCSDFGLDSSAAVGFAKGCFGHGQFGLDADAIEWVSEQFQAGVYKFAVKITSQVGNQSSSVETGQITLTPAARPAEHLTVAAFDKQTNQLVLNVS